MANRAYLWTTDFPSTEPWQHTAPYYDSRWTIPVAWFFLFRPEDVRLVDASLAGVSWREIKAVAEKQAALSHLRQNRSLLGQVVGEDGERARIINGFLQTVASHPGSHILMNPVEVIEVTEDDEGDYERFRSLLSLINKGGTEYDRLIEELWCYSRLQYAGEREFERDVVGYTYW